ARDARTRAGPPYFLAGVVERQHQELAGSGPGNVKTPLIHGGRGGGKAVVRVLAVPLAGKFARPQGSSVRGVQAEHVARAGLFLGARDKDALAPEDRRRMADARQLDLPVVILLGPADGDRGCLVDAGAIGATEASPLLAGCRRCCRQPECSKRREDGGSL